MGVEMTTPIVTFQSLEVVGEEKGVGVEMEKGLLYLYLVYSQEGQH